FSELHHHLRPDDPWRLEGRAAVAKRCGAPVVATNQVHYHVRERRKLHDVLVAIRHRATLDEARSHLLPNSEHCLKGGAEMRPLFEGHAAALATPWDIAQECDLDLDFRKVRFPGYPVPAGETPFSYLYKLCFEGIRERYRPITPEVARRLQHELEVIQKIYNKYGWERTGMVCNVVTFQPRMAIRQVGKALGFSAELLDRLAKGVDRWFTEDVEDSMLDAVPPTDMRPQSWRHFLDL